MKLALALSILVISLSLASDPRLTVLGGDDRLLLDDYNEIWAYPGVMPKYEFVTGGSESDMDVSDGWFALVKNFGGTSFGVAVNHDDYMHEFLVHPGNWGAIVSIDYEKETIEPDTGDAYNAGNVMDVRAVWGNEVGFLGDYSDLALGVGYESFSSDSAGGQEDSRMSLGGSLRAHRDGFINMFPIIEASYESYSISEMNGADVDYSTSTIEFEIGAGHNHMVAPKTRVVLGAFAGVQSVSYGGDYDRDGDMNIMIPDIKGGVEQFVGKWLVFRAGARSTTAYTTTENIAGDTEKEFDTDFVTYFGTGLHWDNFALDATITEDFLHDGPYMVGGSSNGFMGSLAATYNF
jgi:hypothetical protein